MDGLGSKHYILSPFIFMGGVPSPGLLTWGSHRPLSSLWQRLYVGMQDPITVAVWWLDTGCVTCSGFVHWMLTQTALVLIHISHPVSCPYSPYSSQQQCLSFPLPLLLFWPGNWPVPLAAGPHLSLGGSGKHVLLCLASVASYWSWGRAVSELCLEADPGRVSPPTSPPGLSSSTLDDDWKQLGQRREPGLHSASHLLLLPETKPLPFVLILQGHGVLEGLRYGGIHSYKGTAFHSLSLYWTYPASSRFCLWHC